MRVPNWRVVVLGAAVLALGACTAEVEEEGKLPDVDVQAGEVPEIDVDPARVEVGQDTHRVVTPDVDIVPTEGDDP